MLPPQNPSNMSDMWGPSVDNVPHVLAVSEVYNLPFGKGQRWGSGTSGFVGHLISNWNVSGIFSYESGRPQQMVVNNLFSSLLFQGGTQFPNSVAGQSPLAPGSFTNPFNQVYYNSAAFSNPGEYSFGDMSRTSNSIRGFPFYNEDLQIYKDTYFTESEYVRFQASAGNVFNRVDFCPANSTINNSGFGTTFTQCNVPRRIQIGLQIFF